MRMPLPVAVITLAAAWWLFLSHKNRLEPPTDSSPLSGARRALEFISSARAYPEPDIPERGIAEAFEIARRQRLATGLAKGVGADKPAPWRAIGPHNIGGRTLALALNPMNPMTVYAGSASGGLWRSYSGGKGRNAWEQAPTGFPVLAVSSIAIAPEDSNIIYIGTGEMYGNPVSHPGVLGERLNRGSYGIGVLKTTDGGVTWRESLDWLYQQRRGVQMLQINPKRSATVWAATTEGTFVSYDAGSSWVLAHDVVMATDIAINPDDTTQVFLACGGMGSPGHGIYRRQGTEVLWTKMIIPGVSTFAGKIRLDMSASRPHAIYASIGFSDGSLSGAAPTGTRLAKSTDGGDTWTVVAFDNYSNIQGWYAHDVAVSPTDTNIVWAAGQAAVLRSTRGGEQMLNVNALGLFNPHPETVALGLPTAWADYHQILFHPTNPDVIYFANDGGVWLTEDGGRTLRNCNLGYQTTQFYNGVSSSNSDSLFVIGGMQDNGAAAYEGDLFWRRIGRGDGSWTAMNQNDNKFIFWSWQFLNLLKSRDRAQANSRIITPQRGSATNFIAPFVLSPADNITLYAGRAVVYKQAGGLDNEWRLTNGGRPLDGNPLIAMAASFQTPDVVYAATSPGALRGHVFRTTDGGNSWQDVTRNLPDRFLVDLAVAPNDDQTVLVTLGGFGASHLFRSDDAGDAWQDIGAGLPDVPTWAVTVDPDFPQQIFVGNDLGVYFSADGGAAWKPLMAGLPDAIIAMDFTISRSNRTLRVATHGNGFYETKLPTPAPTAIVADETPLPAAISLSQNFPNPFNPETDIHFTLNAETRMDLSVYNIRGKLVRRLVSGLRQGGKYRVSWDGKDSSGNAVSSGVYLYRLKTSGKLLSRMMTLIR